MGPDGRETLFERARELSAQQRTWSDADAVWGEVIEAYRAAVLNVRSPDRDDQRKLAQALWRHSMLLSAMGRAADGLAPGRQAVTLFEQLNEAVAEEEHNVAAAPRDEALAELITAMIDLGEVAFAAGDADARISLIDQALGVGLRTVQPPAAGQRTREAMATGYHNYATALLHRNLKQGGDAQEAALAGSRALQLRQELLDPERPISMWELGNTYAIYAQCLVLIDELNRADMVLKLGETLVDLMGRGGNRHRTQTAGRREAGGHSTQFNQTAPVGPQALTPATREAHPRGVIGPRSDEADRIIQFSMSMVSSLESSLGSRPSVISEIRRSRYRTVCSWICSRPAAMTALLPYCR
jgi:hypothetical protein